MPLNRKIALIAFDRQVSGKGTMAATAKYGFGLAAGSLLREEMTQGPVPLTISSRMPPSVQRTGYLHTVEWESLLWPQSAPLLFFGALGAIASTGTVDPFTHTVTRAATLPYLTAFARLDTEYHKIRDVMIDELTISWDGTELVRCRGRGVGTVGAFYQSAFTVTNDESTSQSFFPAGGTFEVETLGSTPATADITGGELTIRNNIQPVRFSRALEPQDVWPGSQDVTLRLRLIPADTTLWRKILTGSSSGTSVANSPSYGSAHILFTLGVTPARSLDILLTRVAFRGDYPDPDPNGGPVELEIEGDVVVPQTGEPITVTIQNGVNTSGYAGS